MAKLSVSLIVFNEEETLDKCLKSVKDADEIVFIDTGCTDSSAEIAGKYTDKIFLSENTPNLNVNKNLGFSKTTGDWILSLDGDEVITPELFQEIRKIINSETKYAGFFIPRKNHYLGKWLKRGAQYPDYQLRLFKRGKGKFDCKHIHERIKIDGKIGKLKEHILHFPYERVSRYIGKFDRDSNFEAKYLYEKNIRINFINSFRWIILKPSVRFIKRYFFKMGFLDGLPGLFAAFGDTAGFMVRYFKLYEICRKEK